MNYKAIIYSTLFTVLLFGGFSLIFNFGDWSSVGFSIFLGVFVGVMIAPEIEPKKFKFGWLVQVSAGLIAGILVGLFFKLDMDLVVCCGILGGFVGWLAPMWLKHVQIP